MKLREINQLQTQILYDKILERDEIKSQIKEFLHGFDEVCQSNTVKKGIYIYGNPGTGKTTFVQSILKSMDYDVILYNAGDVRKIGRASCRERV